MAKRKKVIESLRSKLVRELRNETEQQTRSQIEQQIASIKGELKTELERFVHDLLGELLLEDEEQPTPTEEEPTNET